MTNPYRSFLESASSADSQGDLLLSVVSLVFGWPLMTREEQETIRGMLAFSHDRAQARYQERKKSDAPVVKSDAPVVSDARLYCIKGGLHD